MTSLTHAPPALLPRLSDAALLLVAIAWGTSYGVAKGALAFYPVLGFLAVRFLLTAVLLAPACVRATPAQRRDAWRAGLPLGGLLLAIFVCETYGVAHTQASNAAFLISLCVVFTPFAEWALLGRRPAARLFGFAAVSLLGAALLAGGWRLQWGLGDALMLAAAVLRAVTVCATSLLARRHAQAPMLLLTAVQSAVVGAACWRRWRSAACRRCRARAPSGPPASTSCWGARCSPSSRRTGRSSTARPAAWGCSRARSPPGARCSPWPGWASASAPGRGRAAR
jgi:hypothetical protein